MSNHWWGHSHEWSPWKVMRHGNITGDYNGKMFTIGEYFVQKRVCKDCGFTDVETTKST